VTRVTLPEALAAKDVRLCVTAGTRLDARGRRIRPPRAGRAADAPAAAAAAGASAGGGGGRAGATVPAAAPASTADAAAAVATRPCQKRAREAADVAARTETVVQWWYTDLPQLSWTVYYRDRIFFQVNGFTDEAGRPTFMAAPRRRRGDVSAAAPTAAAAGGNGEFGDDDLCIVEPGDDGNQKPPPSSAPVKKVYIIDDSSSAGAGDADAAEGGSYGHRGVGEH